MKFRFLLKILLTALPLSGIAQTLEGLVPQEYLGNIIQGDLDNAAYVVNNRVIALGYGAGEFVITSTDGTRDGTIRLLDGVHGLVYRGGAVPSEAQKLNYAQFFFNASNSGKFLYFFVPQSISTTNKKYNLWCTDGSKEGTYLLDFSVEADYRPFLDNNSLIGDDLRYNKIVGTDIITYRISGKDKAVKEFKNTIITSLNADNVMLREYTVNADNTRTYSNDIKILNPKTGQERAFQIPGLLNATMLYTDTEYAYIQNEQMNSMQLIEIKLSTLQTKKLFETSNVKSDGLNGLDNVYGFEKANGNVLFTLRNIKAGVYTFEAWGYKDGQSEAYRITALPAPMNQKAFFKNRWFFTTNSEQSGNRLFSTDGTPGGTEVLAEYPRTGGGYYNETRGYIPVPGFQEVNGNLLYFFRVSNNITGQNDYSIYQIDGSTLKPRIFMENLGGFSAFHKMGNKYYFTDSQYIYESDGTPGGTKKLLTCPGYVNNRFDGAGNLPAWKNRVFVGEILPLSNKLIFNMAALPIQNQIDNILNNTYGYNKAYKHWSPELRDGNSLLWSFDPTAVPFSCESAIPDMRLNCTGEPTVQGFLQYPESKTEWYFNNTLVSGSAGADTLIVKEGGKYKLKVSYKSCESFSNEVEYKVDGPKVTLTKGEGGSQNVFFFKTALPQGRTQTKLEVIYKGAVVATNPNADYMSVGNSPGLYTVRVTDNRGCMGEASIQMGENTNNITANISTSGPSPSASPITLYASNGTGYAYQWKKDGVDIPGATGQQYVATVSGVYTVVITAFGQTAVSAAVYITITSGASFTANITSSSTTAYAPQTVKLTANSGTGYNYQWKKDGVNIPGATGAVYEASQSGSYSVTITTNDKSATSAPVVVIINIPLTKEIEIDGLNLSVFPNPAESYLNINVKTSRNMPVKIDLFRTDGKLLKTWKAEPTGQIYHYYFEIPVAWSGQQLLIKASGGKESITKKIVIR